MQNSPTLTSRQQMKVLLIEDDKYYCEFVRRILNKSAYSKTQLNHARNLQVAISSLKEDTPDVILLDLNLEDSTGLKTLQKLKEFAMDCPIVIITSADNDHLGLTAVKMGAQDYLVKQRIGNGSLLRSLHYAMERHQAQSKAPKNALLQDLLCVLTHDMKTPLASKAKVLEALLSERKGKLTDQQREALYSLKQCNDELSCLVEKLLEIYQRETAELAPELEIVNLAKFIKETISQTKIPEDQTIYFHLNIHPLLSKIFAEKKSLTTVLKALLENAITYGDKSRPISVNVYPLGDKFALDVHNFGEAIAGDIQNLLFQSFWRGIPGQAYVPHTGLSLYLCQGIADKHHGKMTCFSDNSGTRIGLRIPLSEVLQDTLLIQDHHAKLSQLPGYDR